MKKEILEKVIELRPWVYCTENKLISDKIVSAGKDHVCSCADKKIIQKGQNHRVSKESCNGSVNTYRTCADCCVGNVDDKLQLTSDLRVSEDELLIEEILAELRRARTKFPGKNVTFAAMIEEVGEVATALFEESRDNVRKEAVQVAVMAMRLVLDGDHVYDSWRKEKGLDELLPAKPMLGSVGLLTEE